MDAPGRRRSSRGRPKIPGGSGCVRGSCVGLVCTAGERWQQIEAHRVGQLRPGPRDPRLDRAERDVEDVGDLLVVEVDHVAQHHDHPEVVAQPVECGVDRELIVDAVALCARGVVDDLVFAVVGDVERRSTFPLAQLVERGVRGDAVRPGAERGPAVEPRQVADDLDERLLAGVVGIARRAGDPSAHRVDPVVVAAEQLVERAAVAGLRGGDQLGVVESGDAAERNEGVSRPA